MINWHSLIFILPGLLVYAWPGSVHTSIFTLGMHNHSDLTKKLWEKDSCRPDSCCWRWLMELQSSQCPFMRLLVHCLIALPVYNLLLFLVGWHLHKSSFGTAERLILMLNPMPERLFTPQPLATVHPLTPQALPTVQPLPMPPSPPPRCKRRLAPKPPARRVRVALKSPDKYPSHKDPFATVPIYDAQQAERYKTLRMNLMQVLKGLQQPLPPMLTLPLPMPVVVPPKPELHPFDMLEEPALKESTALSDLSKSKRKPSKWLHTVVKRLGKPFARSKSRKLSEDCEDATLSHRSRISNSGSCDSDRSINTVQHFWQRIAQRQSPSRKSKFYVNSPSSSETNSSASCIYAY
ncbi:hypothetical protein KR044_009396 [Drosophila immigrans]|nr:hypothetical protein KR044_009396 [Drosophila immigrans]